MLVLICLSYITRSHREYMGYMGSSGPGLFNLSYSMHVMTMTISTWLLSKILEMFNSICILYTCMKLNNYVTKSRKIMVFEKRKYCP